jgi:hypothetical protein
LRRNHLRFRIPEEADGESIRKKTAVDLHESGRRILRVSCSKGVDRIPCMCIAAQKMCDITPHCTAIIVENYRYDAFRAVAVGMSSEVK